MQQPTLPDGAPDKIFIDVHFHLFNLSHPGILAYANRLLRDHRFDLDSVCAGRLRQAVRRFIGERWRSLVILGGSVFGLLLLIFAAGVKVSAWGGEFLLSLGFPSAGRWPSVASALALAGWTLVFLLGLGLVLGSLGWKALGRAEGQVQRALCGLSFAENAVYNQLLLMERDFVSLDNCFSELAYCDNSRLRKVRSRRIDQFKEAAQKLFQQRQGQVNINGELFQKVILTPLIMDFGRTFKGSGASSYHLCPSKPVVEQIVDLFVGIKQYVTKSPFQLFEVYPFLGLSPNHYDYSELDALLAKYFAHYQRPAYSRLRRRFDTLFCNKKVPFSISINSEGDISCPIIDGEDQFLFAGIKLYPPLGFDPWPEADEEELEKVKLIYKTCNERGIPLTMHFQKAGFRTIDSNDNHKYSEKITEIFKFLEQEQGRPLGLKLNLAHFGLEKRGAQIQASDWTKRVMSLMNSHPDNVYADLAANPFCPSLCQTLEACALEVPNLDSRLLFGSDLPVVLHSVDSYAQYLEYFFRYAGPNSSQHYTRNAWEFLFG